MDAKKLQRMTIQEFNDMVTDDQMVYELIEGLLMMSPRPSTYHQRILMMISAKFLEQLSDGPCEPRIETEVELGEDVLVPDMFVYCDESMMGKQRYLGAPKLVVEILSPSTAFNDLNRKLRVYQMAGVQEYWIVSPEGKMITVHHFDSETVSEFVAGSEVVSDILQAVRFRVEEIF